MGCAAYNTAQPHEAHAQTACPARRTRRRDPVRRDGSRRLVPDTASSSVSTNASRRTRWRSTSPQRANRLGRVVPTPSRAGNPAPRADAARTVDMGGRHGSRRPPRRQALGRDRPTAPLPGNAFRPSHKCRVSCGRGRSMLRSPTSPRTRSSRLSGSSHSGPDVTGGAPTNSLVRGSRRRAGLGCSRRVQRARRARSCACSETSTACPAPSRVLRRAKFANRLRLQWG